MLNHINIFKCRNEGCLKMSLRDLWNVIRKPKRDVYTFTNDDREKSSEVLKLRKDISAMKLEIEKAKYQRELEEEKFKLEDIRQEFYPDDEDEESSAPEDIAMTALLTKVLSGGGQTSVTLQNASTQSPPPEIHYTDEQLEEMLNQLPRLQRKLLGTIPETVFRAKAKEMYNADEDSIRRAWELIH